MATDAPPEMLAARFTDENLAANLTDEILGWTSLPGSTEVQPVLAEPGAMWWLGVQPCLVELFGFFAGTTLRT